MTTDLRPLIAGNWKMNGLRSDGVTLVGALRDKVMHSENANDLPFDLLVAPPATLIREVADILQGSSIAVGGQDCHVNTSGAHTGDISAAMLKDALATYVILGHSERRSDHGEGNDLVRAKASAAHGEGLIAIICVGETEDERDAGNALSVVADQIAGSIPKDANAANTVIAYEPVWAIGTGRTPSVADVAEVHGEIRGALGGRVTSPGSVRILYGGSVKPENAAQLLHVENVNGALVGGASLDADDFWAIAKASG